MDHMIQRSGEFTTGVLGKLDALAVLDVYSRWKRCLPVASRDHHTTLTELKHLIGRRKVRFLYFDAAPEFGSVCSELAIPFQESIPGDPQSNGLIERCNQDILGMTRAALYTSGHPHCFWPFACQAVCFNDGVDHSRGQTVWARVHGKEFD